MYNLATEQPLRPALSQLAVRPCQSGLVNYTFCQVWAVGTFSVNRRSRTSKFLVPQNIIPTIQHMALSIKPLADRVVVKAAAAEATTKSGIIIPDTAKEKPQRGEVVAVGEGRTADSGTLIKPQVKEGDQVLYGKWTGTEITLDGEDYLIMQEKDILAVL
jgi:chaperonin GroES